MTYPGLVLLVGIGLATFLYYMFTESNRAEEQQRYSSNRRRSNHYEDWTERSHRSENALRSSMNSSRETRDFATNWEDVNNCSICQYALNGCDAIQLRPCRHNFHEECINNLRRYNPAAPCPNCRRQIGHDVN